MNSSDPSLKSLASEWRFVVEIDSAEEYKAVIFKHRPPENQKLVGPGSDYELGLMINVPHSTRNVVIHHAIKRNLSDGVAILMHKDATYKIENGSSSEDFARSINSVARQTLGAFKAYAIERLLQIKYVAASLEECLSIAAMTHGAAYGPLNIDEALTAHGLISAGDKWAMFRKQANTSNTKLDLMNIMSEYAQNQDPNDSFKLSMIAGDIFINQGDLEARPAWQCFETIDRSSIPYLMK